MRTVVISLHPALDRIVRVDALRPGDTFDGRVELLIPSGKGVNTARGIASLGGSKSHVVPIVWLGQAERGWYTGELKRLSGLDAVICPRKCATRQALTVLERSGRETHIKEAMAAVTPSEERAFLQLYTNTVKRGDTVVLAGSPPPGVSGRLVRELFSRARARGAEKIVADTHGRLLEIAARAGLDGIKGNAAEIGAWLDMTGGFDPENIAHRKRLNAAFSGKGAPKAVMITRGSKGACYANAEGLWIAPAPKLSAAQFKSATGCGDAATAGWIHAIVQNFDPAETLRFAVACGSAKACSADPGDLDAAIAKRLFAKNRSVKVYTIPKKGLLSV